MLDRNRTGPGFRAQIPLYLKEGILSIGAATSALAGSFSPSDKAKLDLLTVTADSGWLTAVTYATNWASLTNYTVRYRKFPDGMVVLQGAAAKSVALGTPETMFTLPAGYRPGVAVAATQIIYAAASAGGYAEVRVDAAGVVSLEAGGSATWTSVGGITFYAEN